MAGFRHLDRRSVAPANRGPSAGLAQTSHAYIRNQATASVSPVAPSVIGVGGDGPLRYIPDQRRELLAAFFRSGWNGLLREAATRLQGLCHCAWGVMVPPSEGFFRRRTAISSASLVFRVIGVGDDGHASGVEITAVEGIGAFEWRTAGNEGRGEGEEDEFHEDRGTGVQRRARMASAMAAVPIRVSVAAPVAMSPVRKPSSMVRATAASMASAAVLSPRE